MNGPFISIDGGNSRFKVTLFPEHQLNPTEVRIFGNSEVDSLLAYISEVDAASGAMACVGHVEPRMVETIRRQMDDKFLYITPSTPLPIGVRYADPAMLGLDRKATSVAAAAESGGMTVMVIDAGSALTCDLIKDGEFIGGSISPGLSMRFRALHAYTALLPEVTVPTREPIPALGSSTVEGIRSGVALGFLNEVLADIVETGIRQQAVAKVYVTGGDAEFICRHIKEMPMAPDSHRLLEQIEIIHDPHLLAKGVRAIYFHHENN